MNRFFFSTNNFFISTNNFFFSTMISWREIFIETKNCIIETPYRFFERPYHIVERPYYIVERPYYFAESRNSIIEITLSGIKIGANNKITKFIAVDFSQRNDKVKQILALASQKSKRIWLKPKWQISFICPIQGTAIDGLVRTIIVY